MPWTAEYFSDGAYIAYSGHLTGADCLQAQAAFFARPYEVGPRFAVIDLSAVERFDVDRTAVDRIAAQDRAAASAIARDLAIAFVAPFDVAFGAARVWEAQVDDTGWRRLIARSRPEVLRWLADQGIATDRFHLSGADPVAARPVDRFYRVTFADERAFRLWAERVVEFTAALRDIVPELLEMRPVIFVPLLPARGAPINAYVSVGARGLAAHISGGARIDPMPLAAAALPAGLTMLFGEGVDAAEYERWHR